MISDRKLSRRKFLGVSTAAAAGGIVAGLVVGGVAGYFGGQAGAAPATVTKSVTGAPVTQTVTQTTGAATVTQTVTGAPVTQTVAQTLTQTATQTLTQTVTATPTTRTPSITKLNVGYLPLIDTTPVFTAIETGIFSKRGLELEMKLSPGSGPAIEGLLTKGFDIALVASAAVIKLAEQRGIYLKMIHPAIFHGTIHGRQAYNATAIVVRKDGSIKTLKDLEGKKVATNVLGSTPYLAVQLLMKRLGHNYRSIEWKEVPFPRQAEVLATGDIDASCGMPQPFLNFAIAKGIGRPLTDPPLLPKIAIFPYAFGDPNVVSAWWVTEEFAQKSPDAVKQFIEGVAEAIDRVYKDLPAAYQFANKWTKVDVNIISEIFLEGGIFVPYPNGFTDYRFMEPEVKAYMEIGYLEKAIDIKKLVELPWFKP